MDRSTLEFFARATVEARFVQGFMTTRRGWMPFLDDRGVLSRFTGKDGLFSGKAEAEQAGERFKRECREKLENQQQDQGAPVWRARGA
ncbi:hypothetical protein SIID45300_01768 [Candidatus Magnetaquicoccaceae bacterium FCR-1]|uniref:WGR domain-containing protein n=1 Tax=Candidatus Magnetaquiglobus chichijimensis TaxID=3141448 RepID=A0ABQ0C9Q9_9PROT